MMASMSGTPWARAASATLPKTASQSAFPSGSSGVGAPDADFSEARRASTVAGAHHLLGLPFAAVGYAPQGPMVAPGDGRAGIPELRRNAAIAGVLQHAHALAAADLPADFTAELKVV